LDQISAQLDDSDDYDFKTIQGLIHAFLERWGDEHEDCLWLDASASPVKKLIENIKTTEFIGINQLRTSEAHLASTSTLDIHIL
jgi:hypothetical protein